MIKYLGKYRVLCERDIDGEVVEKDFTYLTGTGSHKNSKIYRYDNNVLKLYVEAKSNPTNRMTKLFQDNGVGIISLVDYDFEVDILFNESDIDTVCSLINCKTSGSKIVPESIKNHPRYKEIKQERWDALSEEEKEERILKGKLLRERLQSKTES